MANGLVLLELSLAVPITNSLAFLFTVLGEYFADGKVISKGIHRSARERRCVHAGGADKPSLPDTWIGMALVLAGIALCVYSKTAS
jgi:hypothetical protein